MLTKILQKSILTGSQVCRSFAAHATFGKDLPKDMETKHMNLYQAVNNAMDIALASDPT